jgi:ArsR family transcriptional regulator, nickel/cobalt-responsive transcriptional repressor
MGHEAKDPAGRKAPPAVLDASTAASVAETLQILARLRREPCSVTRLSADIGMEQSAVSHQLRLLRHLGLVTGTRHGKSTVYALYDDHVAMLLDEAVYHSEHLRLGIRDDVALSEAAAPAG